jgi:hypothetical protein
MKTPVLILIYFLVLFAVFAAGYMAGINTVDKEWSEAMLRHMQIHHPNGYDGSHLYPNNQNSQR